MDIKDKMLFVNAFDVKGHFLITHAKSPIRYKPSIEMYNIGDSLLIFLNSYFKNHLPMVNVRLMRRKNITIRDNKNVLPFLEHIIGELRFKKDIAEELKCFVCHRTEYNKRRYDITDHDFYLKVLKMNG